MTDVLSLPLRFEAVGLNNAAVAYYQPLKRALTIQGWRVTYSIGFKESSTPGFAECEFQCAICTGVPVFGNDALMDLGGPVTVTNDFGAPMLVNPNNVPVVGPGPTNYRGDLFCTIMKAREPSAETKLETLIFPDGYGMPFTAADYLMVYFAHESEAPTNMAADCELQGHLFYY